MQAEPAAAEEIPEQIGKYPVLGLLGRGATSTVYRARDPFKQCDVAIKLIDPAVFKDDADPLAKTGFLVEANLVGKLDHPHVTKIYDVVATAGQHFVVMEYVPGGTIERYCQPGSLMDADSAIDVIFKAARALEHVQGLGLVHRDIKPANILIYEGTDIRVTDFGAALTKQFSQTQRMKAGSPLYMSPEQFKGEEVGFQSDMYSLSAVLFQLLTGQPPFQASSFDALTHQIVELAPERPSRLRQGLPAHIDDFIARALSKKPGDRFESWQEYCTVLANLDAQAEAPVAEISLDSQTGRYSLVRRNPFFFAFDDPHLWELIEHAQFRRTVQGDVIMREGELGDVFYVVLAGEVRVTKSGRLINLLTAGAVIGEISYILEGRVPRSATCVSFTDVILLQVPDEWLKGASVGCRSAFERTFMRQLAVRLLDANARLVSG
ncbi:MAG: serine/threonine-protein kinase [Burkholderiales bacterium]